MIQELLSLALPIGKFFIASALMLVFYKLLYRGKSTFNASRFYLLTIAVVSILLSQFNIVVYTPPAKVIEIETPRISVPASAQPVASILTTQVTTAAAATAPLAGEVSTGAPGTAEPSLTVQYLSTPSPVYVAVVPSGHNTSTLSMDVLMPIPKSALISP